MNHFFRYLICVIFFSATLSQALEKKICVSLVVKNDQDVIWRCLESVKEIADCISISDLGSTDKTIEFIEKFLSFNEIPGKIYLNESEKDLIDKSIVFKEAQKTLKHFGFSLPNSYLLTVEPDQVVSVSKAFDKSLLDRDCYLMLNKSSVLSCYYYAPNFFKASVSLDTFISMLNPYGSRIATPLVKLRTIIAEEQRFIRSEEDASLSDADLEKAYKLRKLNLNKDQLSARLKEDSENPRSIFLMAQAQKVSKEYEPAINGYRKRIEKGGDPEEVWFSKYMIGECYEEMGRWVDALYWYLEAYQMNPNRAEPLRKIATYYRLRGENDLAYIFAKHGLKIPYNESNRIFPINPLYDYHFDEEISISAYYTRFKDEGYSAVNDLLLRRDTPYYVKDQGYRNLLFYIQHIKAQRRAIEIPLPKIREDSEERYRAMNPSIIKAENGYILNCRAVNYTQSGAKHFHTSDPEGIYRTKNFLVHYDLNFNVLAQQEVIDDLPREKYRSFIVEGLEDVRIFQWNNSIWFTCTTFDTNPTGAIQVSLCKTQESEIDKPVKLEILIPLQGPDPNRHEKNWLPFVKEGQLNIIYSSDPFTILQPDLETGECKTALHYIPHYDFSRFRGSAAPVEFDDGYLMLVHEVVTHSDYTRSYLHRFVFLDDHFQVRRTSRPFLFLHDGVEFCNSMTIDHKNENLIMAVGIEDKEAHLFFVNLNEIRGLLGPLPLIYPPF